MPAGPFSRSRGRERGENMRRVDPPKENARSGESGEKRDRSTGGYGGGTATARCSLKLDEGVEEACEEGVSGC
jgi:hypothetical protein